MGDVHEDSPRSVGDLLRARARTVPEPPALVQGGRALSWGELDAAVTAFARGFAAAGAERGDRVALTLPAGPDVVPGYLGALRAGLVAVPLNPAYTGREVRAILADCGARLHVAPDDVAGLRAPGGSDPRADLTGETLATLAYTSGTSGRPRAAMLSARALLANLDQLAAVVPALLTAADVLFLPLPLSHVFGLNAGVGLAVRQGATIVLPAAGRFDAGATLAEMAGASVVVGVPGQFAAWLEQPGFADGFAHVRLAVSGSATLPRALVGAYAERGIVLRDGYGLTEAAAVVSLDASPDGKPGSVGAPLPGIEVQVRDRDGEPVDEGDPGRLFVRGANLFSGYWPDGDGAPDADGWFGTGDLGVLDADGALCLVGRIAEVVVVNGFPVYPAEVEAVLGADPAVAEVAVVGVPDERTGEAVHAFVVPAPGVLVRPDDLLASAARSLARFKLPAVVEVVSTLPHTVTGKVRKWVLGAGDDGTA